MGEAKEVQMEIMDQEKEAATQFDHLKSPPPPLKRWLKIIIYAMFVLSGQTAATILGRLYFDKGGNSNWLAALVQPAGFPLIILFYLLKNPTSEENSSAPKPTIKTLFPLYTVFGVFLAFNCLLYALGLSYLPVSTYTLICASQLGFNALFSYFINSQKLTPFIINSVVLLTLSSALLMFETDSSESKETQKGKYAIGFVCTVAASAGYGLMLSMTQFCFRKVFKQENIRVVLDMILYPSIPATLVVVCGLFASGEWSGLKGEMEGFELGKLGYLMTLIWTAISWQVFSIGCVGLIFEVSSLFSNVIGTLGLPVVPVLAVFVFGDEMSGLKVISMVLAFWGFVSYVYQHYVDGIESRKTSLLVE